MFKIIDLICSFVWGIFILLNKLIFAVFYCVFFLLANIWNLFCQLGAFGRLLERIENVIKLVWKNTFLLIFAGIAGVYKKLIEYISDSKYIKRIFTVVVILIAAYCIFPPSHWGPWSKYEVGTASWYGPGFYWKLKADGSRYYPWDVSAAHKKLPLGSIIKVKNLDNGKTIYLKVDDRGPYVKNRIIDLSYLAAVKLGMKKKGLANVEIYIKKK